MRTSPVYYLAPSSISIVPNYNGTASDLAVTVAHGTKLKVFYPSIFALGTVNGNYQEWTLSGRNRRLADNTAPYTIYARLRMAEDPTSAASLDTAHANAYLVFAKQTKDADGKWTDPYILSPNPSSTSSMNNVMGADNKKHSWPPIPTGQTQNGRTGYWWLKLGTVSAPDENGQRTAELDTGILGTEQYNVDWYLNPAGLPERPVREIQVDRKEWVASPKDTYTGETGSTAPDGTLEYDVASKLGWTGTEVLSFVQGQIIDEPYHCRSLTRNRWLTKRLDVSNSGYNDKELYERLTSPTRGWDEENWVETSRVWHNSSLWECQKEGTTDEPSDDSADWRLLMRGGADGEDGDSGYSVELTKSSDSAIIDPSGNVVGGYRLVSKDGSQTEYYSYRFFTSASVMKGGEYLHLCGAMDDDEELGEGNFTIEAIGAGCDLKMEGTTCYITSIWHCNDGNAGTPNTSYSENPEEYQLMRAMTECVAHITLNIEGKTAVTTDYRLQLVHLPTDTVVIESHNEVAAVNWSTKKNAWTNQDSIVIPLTASSGGQPVRFQTVNGEDGPDIRLLNKPTWLSGFSLAWADYKDGSGTVVYTASQHMAVEISIPIANIKKNQDIKTSNLLRFNVVTTVDGVEYENIVPFTLNTTTDKAVYVLAPSVRQVVGTMIGGTWDAQSKTVSNARYSYSANGAACDNVSCRLMSYDENNALTEITNAGDIHDNVTFLLNGQPSSLAAFRAGLSNTAVAGKNHTLYDELQEIVFAIRLDGNDYESEGVPVLRNGAQLSIGSNGNWYIGGVDTGVFAKGTEVISTKVYYTDPVTDSTPPAYAPADAQRGLPVSPYLNTECPEAVEGKFIHYVSITIFSDSEETYVYSYGTIGTGNTITVIHDRDYYASHTELSQAQLKAITEGKWSENTPADYSAYNRYLYARDTARYYKNGAEQNATIGGIAYPKIVYTLLSYWGQDGSGVEFIYYLGTTSHTTGQTPAPSTPASSGNGKVNGKVTPYAAHIDDWVPDGWTDNPQGIDYDHQVEWVSQRTSRSVSNGTVQGGHEWSAFSEPKVWSKWGQNGMDGDGVEYVFMRTTKNTAPVISTSQTDYDADEFLPSISNRAACGAESQTCTDDPQGVSSTYPFEWVAKRTKAAPDSETGKRSWEKFPTGGMQLWSNYSQQSDVPMQAFQWNQSATEAPSPLPSGASLGAWRQSVPNRPGDGHFLWMTQTIKHTAVDGTVTYDTWSTAVRISGDTGTAGEDGSDTEWVYTRNNTGSNPGTPGNPEDRSQDDYVPTGWTDNPQGIDYDHQYEYASFRTKPSGKNQTWGAFSTPVLWSHWGTNGMDGDGVEYVFARTATATPPKVSDNNSYTSGGKTYSYTDDEFLPAVTGAETMSGTSVTDQTRATDDPQGVSDKLPYEWVAKRTKGVPNAQTGKRSWNQYAIGDMQLWAKYGKDGAPGTALVVDLINRNISIPLDEDGHLQSAMSLTTAVQAFFDTTELDNVVITDTADKPFSTANDNDVIGPYTISTDGKKVNISVEAWTESDMTALYAITAIEMKVTCRDASDNLLGSRTVTLSLTAFKSGGVGENAMFCDLMPQPGALKFARTASGGYDPASRSLTVYLKSVDGQKTELKLLSETGYTCRYSYTAFPASTSDVDGVAVPTTGTDADRITNISPDNGNTLYLSLFSGTTRIDFEDVPIVSDGKGGENSIRLALDNEHEDFLYDGSRLVAPSAGASSPIRLYDGGNDITASMPAPEIHSVSGTTNGTGGAYISNKTLYVKSLTASTCEVVVKCTYNGTTYYAKFTANKTNQDKYDIVCKPSSIAYNSTTHADKAGTATIQTVSLSATGIGIGGTSLSPSLSASVGAGRLCVFWAPVNSNGMIGGFAPSPVTSKAVTKQECESYVGIYFELRYYTSSSDYRVCDYETVEIAKTKDGANGSALVVDLTNRNVSIPLDEDGHLQNAMSLTTAVQAFFDTTEVTDVTVTDTSGKSFSTANGNNVVGPYKITASGKTIRIDVSKWTDSDMTTRYAVTEITMRVTCRDASGNLLGTRDVTLSLTSFKSGGVGENAMFCDLMPQPGALKFARTANGGYDPASRSLTVYLKSVDGKATELKLLSETGYTCRYSYTAFPASTSDGEAVPTTGTNADRITGISPDNGNTLYLSLFSDTTRIDFEDVPIVSDGKGGENSIRLALDNEHEDFLYDGSRLVAPSAGASSPIRLYDGGNDITASMPAPEIHSVSGTTNGTGGAYISNKTLYVKSLTASTCEVVVKCTYNGTTYYAKFTANKTNQDKYDIVCKPSSIAYNSTAHATDNDGAVIQNISLSASGIGIGGTPLSPSLSTSVGAGRLCVFWAYVSEDGTVGNFSGSPVTSKAVTKLECETYAGIYFELRYYTGSNDYRVCDYETVEIAKTKDGTPGDDAVNYDIVFTEAWAKATPEGVISARLRGHAYKIDGSNRTPLKYTTIRYGYNTEDNETLADTTTNSLGYFTEDTWFDGDSLDGYAKGSAVVFASIIIDGQAVCTKYVTIVQEAADGKPGHVGRWYYYAGDWQSGETYTMQETQAPFVKRGDSFYMLDFGTSDAKTGTTQLDPASNYNPESGQGSKPWTLMQSTMQYYIAQAFFGPYAHFGSFIINGDWMISQYGTLVYSNGTRITVNASNVSLQYGGKVPYAWFDPTDPTAGSNPQSGSYKFIPNFAVDGLTGQTYQQNAFIRGEVHATSGDFRGTVYASAGEFTGKIKATGGFFKGENSDGFSINFNADDRRITIKGPSSVKNVSTLAPATGSVEVEYVSIGQFRQAGGSSEVHDGERQYYIQSDIRLYRPGATNNYYGMMAQLDTFDGLIFKYIHKVTGEANRSWYGPNSMRVFGGTIFIDDIPDYVKNRNSVKVGQVYLDGETLKVRLT